MRQGIVLADAGTTENDDTRRCTQAGPSAAALPRGDEAADAAPGGDAVHTPTWTWQQRPDAGDTGAQHQRLESGGRAFHRGERHSLWLSSALGHKPVVLHTLRSYRDHHRAGNGTGCLLAPQAIHRMWVSPSTARPHNAPRCDVTHWYVRVLVCQCLQLTALSAYDRWRLSGGTAQGTGGSRG